MNKTRCLDLMACARMVAITALAAMIVPAPTHANGVAAGNLQRIGTLELQLKGDLRQFVLLDNDGNPVAGPQRVFDRKAEGKQFRAVLGLDPKYDPANETPDMLVSIPDDSSIPTIDEYNNRIGTGNQFWLKGFLAGAQNRLILEYPLPQIVGDAKLVVSAPVYQIEAYYNAVVKIQYFLDGEPAGQPYYLLSGNSGQYPPPEVPLDDPSRFCVLAPNAVDQNTSAFFSRSEGFCELPDAPPHDREVLTAIKGKVALKDGTSKAVSETQGVADCGDGFATPDRSVSGGRTQNLDQDCTNLVTFDLEFDPATNTVGFDVAELDPTDKQNLGLTFRTRYGLSDRDSQTIVSLEDTIDCSDVEDPFDPASATRACFGSSNCVGQPDRFCATPSDTVETRGDRCETSDTCDTEAGESCRLFELIPPPAPGFPDLVASTDTLEYACILENTTLYVGTVGVCSNDRRVVCESVSDCPADKTNTGVDGPVSPVSCDFLEEQIRVEETNVIFDDVRFGRR